MDPYTEQLIERTRQRRALLNQKLGKTPDPVPRKRVLEDATNQPDKQVAPDDESPKRHCTWEADGVGKADTPAITGVKSRLQALSEERTHWSDARDQEQENQSAGRYETRTSPVCSPQSRRSRFAQLAQNLDNFECDMSHPAVKKQEEKRPRWQPPQRDDDRPNNHHDAKDRHVSSPRKEYESYQGPTRRGNNNVGSFSPQASPKKHHAPAPPTAPPLPQDTVGPQKPPRMASPHRSQSPAQVPSGSPKVSQQTIQLQQPQNMSSPKFTHQIRRVTNQVPVNKRVEPSSEDEPTQKPVTERLASWKKTVDTPNKRTAADPTELPLSERFADWEQRVTADNTPARKVQQTPKQFNTPSRTPARGTTAPTTTAVPEASGSTSKPVSDVRASWKRQDEANNPKREEEPTAYSVGDRMSAWEVMSSSNKVSYIKKVDPGSPGHSPVRQTPGLKPGGTPNKGASWKTPNKGLTPQKSFKDSIEEKAAQMGRRTAGATSSGGDGLPPKPPSISRSPSKSTNSPSKTSVSPSRVPCPQAASPTGKVGSATKSLQEKILNKVQYSKTDKLADKMRQERMAEVSNLNNRYQNGILKDDRVLDTTESESEGPAPPLAPPAPNMGNKKESVRAKARQDFNHKLQAMGFELSDEGTASYTFDQGHTSQRQPSSASKKPTSIYRLVSKKCTKEEEKPVVKQSTSSLKKVQFQDHNTSTESDSSSSGMQQTDTDPLEETEDDFDPHSEEMQSETQESFDDTFDSGSESSIPESYKSPTKRNTNGSPQKAYQQQQQQPRFDSEDDDISMSAFVPDSIRRQSVLPHGQGDSSSMDSTDSIEYSGTGSQSGYEEQTRKKLHRDNETDSEDEGDRADMDNLLDEALDDLNDEVEMRNNPVPQPRKRHSHMYATTQGEVSLPQNEEVQMRSKSDGLAYSVSMYRNSKHTKITTTVDFREMNPDAAPVSQRISRKSHYTQSEVVEEDIQMPTQLPPDVQRLTLQERIKELQELVSQEQSVILQTSNALNKCCMGDSMFAGSAEQVECNRLLLVSCQRRQAYLTEAQRLKETRQLEPRNQQGPKGSLTITDIRLPLKKDFVTKIGTASDNTVHYFMILIRNGPQIIKSQMLSTHDPMMRGSLDFPDLIKIHGISASFNISLEIYSMSVSREQLKDKKKKTPKKTKYHTHMPLESPGGPTAVRTTSFFLITSMPITMKCLDKSSFSLERIPYLSPLHGMIYMRLKCMMEQNVEERGFLTMFEDVSGLGSWHRRWCVLAGNKLCYWKYPDDENKKDPMGLIDMKRVITEKVGLIPRDICARPHTFELVSVRPPRKGEHDTLVTKTYNTMTTTRFMLSADTKEERIVWCNKVNRALANIRTWHADAMRPVRSGAK